MEAGRTEDVLNGIVFSIKISSFSFFVSIKKLGIVIYVKKSGKHFNNFKK